jgi:hypothetical protein
MALHDQLERALREFVAPIGPRRADEHVQQRNEAEVMARCKDPRIPSPFEANKQKEGAG